MASMTMTAPFLAASTSTRQVAAAPRRVTLVKAAAREAEKVVASDKGESSGTARRDLMFAAAAAVACSVAKVAMAEPKPGSDEAKKKYAAICVTMPTARICHK